MKVIYYSRETIVPALLAAVRHRYGATAPGEIRRRACAWRKKNIPEESSTLLKFYDRTGNGENLYIASSAAPPDIVERTLTGMHDLAAEAGKGPLLFAFVPGRRNAPPQGWKKMLPSESRDHLTGLWPEIEAAVGQIRLRISLQQSRK